MLWSADSGSHIFSPLYTSCTWRSSSRPVMPSANSCEAAHSMGTSTSGHGASGLMYSSIPFVSPLTTGSFIQPISIL